MYNLNVKYNEEKKKKKIIPALLKELKPTNCALVRAHVIKALEELDAIEYVDTVRSVLQDPHDLPRAWAARALEKFNVKTAIPDLIEIAKVEDKQYQGSRKAATFALKKICPKEDTSEECSEVHSLLYKITEEAKQQKHLPGDEADRLAGAAKTNEDKKWKTEIRISIIAGIVIPVLLFVVDALSKSP